MLMMQGLLVTLSVVLVPLAEATDICRNAAGASACTSASGSSFVQRKSDVRASTFQEVSGSEDKNYQSTNPSTGNESSSPGLPRRYTVQDLDRAKELVESPTGMLLYHAAKASVNLCEFKAFALGAPENGNGSSIEDPTGHIEGIMGPWCSELTRYMNRTCDSSEPFAELVTQTRCVLEASIAQTGFPQAPAFAFAMELMDIAEWDCMSHIEARLGTREAVPMKCPGEWGNAPTDAEIQHADEETDTGGLYLAEFSSEAQVASATAQEVWRVAGHVEYLANRLHEEPARKFETEAIKSLWQQTCKTLGCDVNSYNDITDALYGHTAKLIELDAPGAAIHHHIKAMGHARRAYMKMMQSKPLQDGFEAMRLESLNYSAAIASSKAFVAFLEAPSQRAAVGTMTYNAMWKSTTQMLSAVETMVQIAKDLDVPLLQGSHTATAASAEENEGSHMATAASADKNEGGTARWGGRRRRRRDRRRRRCCNVVKVVEQGVTHVAAEADKAARVVGRVLEDTFACASLSIGETVGFEKSFTQYTGMGLKVTLEDASAFAGWIQHGSFSVCRTLKIHATVTVAGPAPKNPLGSCSAGVAFNLEAHIDSCGSAQIGVSVSFGGGCNTVHPNCGSATGFMKKLKIDCVKEYFISATVACAKFELPSGKYVGRTS